jgi:hypothetical protein
MTIVLHDAFSAFSASFIGAGARPDYLLRGTIPLGCAVPARQDRMKFDRPHQPQQEIRQIASKETAADETQGGRMQGRASAEES